MDRPQKKDTRTSNKYVNEDNKIYNQSCDDWEPYHKQELIKARIEELKRQLRISDRSWNRYTGYEVNMEKRITQLKGEIKND